MANLQVIDPNQHKDLRVAASYDETLGHGMGAITISPSEILEVQREYPILFRKHPETGHLLIVALLGFDQQENLFLANDSSWNARYIPLAMSRGPFLVGVGGNGDEQRLMICINRDDPRVSEDKGEMLFGNDGKPSAFLEGIRQNLLRLHQGIHEAKSMVDAFLALNLIEPVKMDIQLRNNKHVNFGGAYTINTDILAQLTAEQVKQLNDQGYLALAYFIAGSLNNISALIDLKNNKGF